MQEELKALGFSYNERRVYQSLLKIGETPVGGILQDTKRMHRQSAYNALETLEKKEMINKKKKNGIYHFHVANPTIFIDNIRKQELIAKRLSRSIAKELKKKKREHEINVFEGATQIRNSLIKNIKKMPKGGTFYILSGTTEKFTKALEEDFFINKYDKIRSQKKILSKVLTGKNLKKELGDFFKIADRKTRLVRYLPWDIPNPMTTVIWDDKVGFYSYIEGEQFIIEIKNKLLRDSYLEHFHSLWSIAKK